MTRNRWLVVVLAVVVLGGATLFVARRGPARVTVDVGAVTRQARFRSTVTASGEIVATRYADIGSSVMGKIVSLPVAEGDRVKAGQMLARIDPVQAQSGASGAAAQVRALEAEERGAAEQIRGAISDLAVAEARARDAEQQLSRKRDLFQQALIPASDFESARATAEAAHAQVTSVRATIDRARQTADAAARRIAQARAQQTSANDMLAKTSIASPIDGIVSRLRVREGEMVVIGIQNQPGTTLMTISDLGAINAEVKVAEADVLRVVVGQAAVVTLEALPGKQFPGKVVEIGASALPVSRHRRGGARVQGRRPARPAGPRPAARAHLRRRDRDQRAHQRPHRAAAERGAPSGAARRRTAWRVSPGRRPGAVHAGLLGRDRRTRHRSERGRRRGAGHRRSVPGAPRPEGRHARQSVDRRALT